MEKEKLISICFKRKKQINFNNFYTSPNDLFQEASAKRCYRYYDKPDWVTPEYEEVIDYIMTLDFNETRELENKVDNAYYEWLHHKYKKNRESYQKRFKAKEIEGEKWKGQLKPGDIIEVFQSPQSKRCMIVMETGKDTVTGRYLNKVWNNEYAKTPYIAEKMYKFIIRKVDDITIVN